MTTLDANGWATDDTLAQHPDLESLTEIRLGGSMTLTDAGLAPLARCRALTSLGLDWCSSITDAGLRVLGELPTLERVDLNGSPVGDDAAQTLSSLPRLRSVLAGTRITDRGLASLATLSAYNDSPPVDPGFDLLSNDSDLPRLWLTVNVHTTNEGLRALSSAQTLGHLELNGSLIYPAFWSGDCPIDAGGLRHLAGMPRLQGLAAAAALSDDDGLAAIRDLPHLQYLSIQETTGTLRGFEVLASHPTLEHLYAGRAQRVSGEVLGILAGMPRLARLSMGGPAMRGADYRQLQPLASLRELVPYDGTDETMRQIATLEQVRSLDFMFCDDVTDEGFEAIAGMQLRRVRVFGTRLTDRGMRALARIGTLEEAYIDSNGVTDRGRSALRDAGVRLLA